MLLLAVLFGGLYFALKLRAFYILHPAKVLRGMLSGSKNTGESSFKSVTLALAGTLGVGNIVGVSSAIILGGAGAVFWMWVGAFISMALKYSEILLGVRYRRTRITEKGISYYGGAAYYISDGLFENRVKGKLPYLLGGAFALFCIVNSLTTGTAIQTGAVSGAVGETFNISPFTAAVVLTLFVLLAMLVGNDRFSSVTVVLIPIVSAVYVIMSLYVILLNVSEIPQVFGKIISEAFDIRSTGGGLLGCSFVRGMRYGIGRGIISNEAGCGTAPAAHARANVKTPAQQGFWGIFEVFADTIVLCSMTAFAVLIYSDNVDSVISDGMQYTLIAYESVMGDAAGYLISACIFVFAYATVLCQFYYGIESVRYLSRGKTLSFIYTVLFFAMIFYGALSPAGEIWQLTDLSVGIMTFINVTVLLILRKTVFSETDRYFGKRKKAGVQLAHRR
ncbi:MAG: alanine:cation symporter family protein [Clostridia bacterium]|nr:alanine:cation symporter family protein [Clostridia bacterium]